MSSTAFYQQQFLNNNQLNSNLKSNLSHHVQNGNHNYDLINNQSYSHQLARACPLAIQQRTSTNNLTNSLLNGNSLDALNTVGLSTATKDVFKKPITTMHKNGSQNTMSFTRHLLINSSGHTGSTGQLNTLTNSLNKCMTNGHSNGLSNGMTSSLTNGLTNGIVNCHINGLSTGLPNDSTNGQLNGLTNGLGANGSEVDVRRLCLSEQQQLEFNLVQELEQKSKLSEQQNQQNLNTEITHSTPKQSYGTLKKNKQNKQPTGQQQQRTPESKVRNICAKLFGSNSKSSSNNNQTKPNESNGHCSTNGQSPLGNNTFNGQLNQLINGQPKSSSKLLASAVTQANKSSKLSFKLDEQSKEDAPNVIYAEIRKKQVNNCEKPNQIASSDFIKSSSSSNNPINSNCNLASSSNCNIASNQNNCNVSNCSNNNSSIIDDKYVVVVDSANSDQNTSNQSLTVKNSPLKPGILTTDLDQSTTPKTTNSQQVVEEQLKNEMNQQVNHQQLNQTQQPQINQKQLNQMNHLTTQVKKQEDDKIGLESPTISSSSESGRGTLNGEQQSSNGHPSRHQTTENNFDQTSVTSDDMKRLKTFKEEVLENWNQNKKLIVSNCIVSESSAVNSLNNSASDSVGKLVQTTAGDEKDLNTFEQVQLKIQKLLNDDDAFINDEDFDDLIASEAYQSYTAQTMNHCTVLGDHHASKLDRLSVVNEFTNESDASWLSDSTNANSVKNKLNQSKSKQQQLSQSNQQLNQSTNLNNSQSSSHQHHHLQTANNQSTSNMKPVNKEDAKQAADRQLNETNNQQQTAACVNSLKRNSSTLISQQQQPTQSSSSQTKLHTPTQQQQQQSPRLLHHHLHVHQSPKSTSIKTLTANSSTTTATTKTSSKMNPKSIAKLNTNQQQTNTTDFATLLSENSKRLNKLNLNKNQYNKNRSMDDLTDLMDDLNSVYTEATLNYTAPTVVKKQLKGIESMYSEILTLLNSRMDSVKAEIRPSLMRNKFGGSESSLNTEISRCYNKPLKPSYLNRKGAMDDINSRKMKRLENHVITLSKSVALLTNEIRSNQNLNLEIQYLRKEVESLKNRVQFNLMISDDLNNNKMQQQAAAAGGTLPRKSTTINTQPQQCTSNTLNAGGKSLMSGFKRLFGDEQPQVRQFLKKLGYEKYASKFEAEKIGINELIYLTEDNLKKLGMPMGPRVKLLQEIQQLNA